MKQTDNALPFEDFWKKGLDIISRWNEIDKAVQEYNDRKRRQRIHVLCVQTLISSKIRATQPKRIML